MHDAALGAAVGAAVGALGGSLADVGIHDQFIEDVKSEVKPGTSALSRRNTRRSIRRRHLPLIVTGRNA
ncbi:DUF1269 domain-containing protein [Streptomyces sp. H27-H1]|uniref:DUF1269 domain-containing protein n=1 Tax=Streptomyces sp. H27-H1 TaxID=2996461 RepID=UPI00227013EB|nr:DUF1269 domain-containing protein [Streptomyces sp. H27-H1]MCY0926350.1 DUF1269 domain-containing protein [Streptomyces sp. H27-H1]